MHAGAAWRGETVASAARGGEKGYVNSLGALTGGQALQQAKAGIEAIYLSGWQVAADANTASSMYPDQSLYPANSVPAVVDRINNTFRRADQIQWSAGIEPERSALYRLLPADRGGCGGRFWRRPERL